MKGNDALPFVQVGVIAFGPSNASRIATNVRAGEFYSVKMTIQTRAASASNNGRLSLQVNVKPMNLDSKLQQMIIVPTQGINSKGQSIQTLNVTGILYAGTDFEAINLSLVESSGKKITSTTGVIELIKINYQPMTSKPSSNLVAKAKATATTAAAKAKATAGK
jgi:hypothetical protein